MNIIDTSISTLGVKSIITVGAFDGVHLGHQEILKRLSEKAIEIGGYSVVVTFWPHPRHVLQKNNGLKLLNTIEEKRRLIESHRIDYLIELPFTQELSNLDAQTFIKRYLVDKFNMKFFLLGFNHHFGKDRLGNVEVIKQYALEFGFEGEQVKPRELSGEKISSTKIRNALTEGMVELANQYLGYNYSITGSVGEGQKLGRKINFPTANIQVKEDYKLIPKDGVYAVKVNVDGLIYNGMLNIGYRPTVNQNIFSKTVEVHILDFNEDIYNKTITVQFLHRIRDEIKFAGIEHLKNQLVNDMKLVRELFSKN